MTAYRPDDVVIERLADADGIAGWRGPFVEAYVRIFADAPYHELYAPEDAGAIYDRLTATREHISLIASVDGHIAGFGIAVPLSERPGVARAVGGLLPPRATFYLAELGVCPEFRGLGIGRRLIVERLQRIDRARYTHVMLRVAAEKNRSYDMYLSLGFEDTGVYMEVPARRTDGSVRNDRRLFLSHTLSQVDLGRMGDLLGE